MGTAYGNSFDPRSLSPALWLSDTGSDPAVWEDLSGNGRNATQATASAQPAIVSNALNGRQVRRFDGSKWMQAGTNSTWNFLHNGTACHVFIAVKCGIVENPNSIYSLISTGGDSSANIGYSLTYDDRSANSRNNVMRALAARGVPGQFACDSITQNAITPNQFNILTNRIEAGNATASLRSQSRVNGTDIANNNTLINAPSTANSTRPLQIGADGSALFLNGDIAEILVFPAVLSTEQRQSVENYLAKKWGLGFNPLSLGPALWLDASDSSTLYDATTGGSLVGTGGAVARWEDKSGNARHATQATLANRPLRTLGVQGGKDVLAFDGSNDFLATPAFGGTQDCTYFLVTASKNSTQYKVFAAHANSYENPPLGANYVAVNAARLETTQNGASGTTKFTAKLAASQNLQNNVFRIAEVELTSTNAGHIQRVNGTAHATTNLFSQDPGVFTKLAQSFGVGAYNTGNFPCNCDIAEIIYFTKLLTANDRREVQRYLAQKWNIIP